VSSQLHDQLAAPEVAGIPTAGYPVVSVVHGPPPFCTFLHLRRVCLISPFLPARYDKSGSWS
jgi:hypothetical protein